MLVLCFWDVERDVMRMMWRETGGELACQGKPFSSLGPSVT